MKVVLDTRVTINEGDMMKKQVGAVLAGTAAVGILATVTFGLAGQVGARPVSTDVVASRTVHRDGDGADHLAPIASVLGVTADELQSALHSGQSLADVAASKGIAVQTVVDAVVADMKSHIASEVASGELTQAEADAKLVDVVAKATEIVNGTRPEGAGHDRGFERGPRGPGLDAIASVLGVTADELQSALHSGQSLADVAASKGVAVQTVVDAVVADMKSHIASEVASGELTQAEADAKLADVVAKATEIVNGTRPEGAGHDRGFERGPRGPGLDAIASVLGMTADGLQSALHSGQSLADVAASKGVAVQTVVDAVVADMKSHIASEVASGELTHGEADAKLADVVAKATAIVNGAPGKDFPGRHRGGHDERGPVRGRHGNIQPSAMVTESNA